MSSYFLESAGAGGGGWRRTKNPGPKEQVGSSEELGQGSGSKKFQSPDSPPIQLTDSESEVKN